MTSSALSASAASRGTVSRCRTGRLDSQARCGAAMLVVVQIGQCGNQVGAAFWAAVAQQQQGQSPASGPHSLRALLVPTSDNPVQYRARCVLVDAEPKAVLACVASTPLLAQCPVVTATGAGHGGNWACGYSTRPGDGQEPRGDSLLARAVAAVGREVDKCPTAPDLLLLLGATGGTGGGLGCALLEQLRRVHRHLFIAAAVVGLGEGALLAPVASCFTAQFLDAYADAVFLFSNAELCSSLERSARTAGEAVPLVTLSSVNATIGRALCAALCPGPPSDAAPCGSTSVRDIVAHVSQPGLKFLDIRCGAAPHGAYETDGQLWSSLVAAVAQDAPKRDLGAPSRRLFTSTASLLILRGCPPSAAVLATQAAHRALGEATTWGVAPGHGAPRVVAFSQGWCGQWDTRNVPASVKGGGTGGAPLRTACLVSNRDACVVPLAAAADGCDALLASGAYMNQLARWGVTADAVADAVAATRAVVQRYAEARRHE